METRSGRFVLISVLTAVTIFGALWVLRFESENTTPPVKSVPDEVVEPPGVSQQQLDTLNCQSIVRVAIGKAFSGNSPREQFSSGSPGFRGGAGTGPSEFKDDSGEIIGEYTSWRARAGRDDLVMAASAVPSFEAPRVMYSIKIRLEQRPDFTMATKPGAISIAGTLVAPSFPLMGSNSLLIDGGERPALLLSSKASHSRVLAALEERVLLQGGFTGLELRGPGDSGSPVACEEAPFITALKMNEYRDILRSRIKILCEKAEATKVSKAVRGDRKWGDAAGEKLVVIDAAGIGADAVFPDEGQNITGYGTLVILGALWPRANLNLRWTGDVFVLGEGRLDSDLLYLHGSDIRIVGNLVLLSEKGGAVSLELKGSSASTVSAQRPTRLEVTGGLVCLADAVGQEAELELDAGSMLKVDGILGLFGSRIEIEAGGEDSVFEVRGSLAAGIPRPLEEAESGSSNFEFEMRGKVNISFVEAAYDRAITGLALLESGFGIEAMRDRNAHYQVNLWKSMEDFEPGGEAMQEIRESLLHPAAGEELGLRYQPSEN